MGKGGRRETQNGNHSSSFFLSCNSNSKAEQTILKPCKRCGGEISKLREINQMLIKDISTSPQDFKACFLQKVAQMESQIHILQAASTNFGSKMNNQFIQQVKIGEELGDNLMKIDNEFRQHLVKRDEECYAGISKAGKQLQEAAKRFERDIADKEEDCRAVFSDKQTLESSVLQLTDKINVISEEFDEARKAWELEKDELFSQIVAARNGTAEIAKSNQITEQAWNADKENLLCSLDMFSLNERVLLEKIELESQLNESKETTEELLKKHDDDRYLWCSEKQNFRDNASKLETKIFNMATERGFLCQRNRTLIAEVEFLKAQLNENIAKVAQIQDERVQNERVLQQYRTENIDLQFNLDDSQGKSQDLLRKIEENTHFWGAEKSNLEGNVAELRAKHELMASEMVSLTQKNRDLTVDLELIKCQLNESKKRSLELLQKSEEDRHMWDEEKSNLERTLAELQTKNEDLMLQLSRKKAVEEDFLAEMSSLEEMKEYTSKGEIQIDNLRSRLLAVAEKTDGQLSDLQRELSAMAEEKKRQRANLHDQLSSIADGKNILEENKCLQSELEKGTLASEEEKVILQGRVWELQTTFDSLNNELQSCRAMAEEKDRQFADLQIRQSELEEAKKHLEYKSDSLLTELNRSTMSRDENIRLQNRIRELETEVESLKKDSESKENCLPNLMLERQPVCRKALVPVVNANGTSKRNGAMNEKPKPNGVLHENGKLKAI